MKALYIPIIFLTSGILSAQSLNEQLEFTNLYNTDLKESVSCYRIPSIITAKNGDIITAIDERIPSCGDLKWSNDINIVMRRSSDNGETWSEIERIVDYPWGESASDPSMIIDQETGKIFLLFNYMNLTQEKDIYYLKMIISEDHGVTWSDPVDITEQITKPEWVKDFKFITSGRGIQTRDGTLLHTLVRVNQDLHLFKSEDHGVHWELIPTPIAPGDESKVIELSDGSWMVNSRVNQSGVRYTHHSFDKGKTWTSKPDSTLVDPGCNASIIRYSSMVNGAVKNRILFTNASSDIKRENLTIRLSYDEGSSWSKGKTIYAGKSAYSSMTILRNGDIGLFFEKDDYKENVFVKFSLEWLTDGADKGEE